MLLLFSTIAIGDSLLDKDDMHRPHLIVGDDINYPPYSYLDEDGNPAGFNIELAKYVGTAMGYDVEFRLDEWNKVRQALEDGEIDVISGMFYSAEREEFVSFSSKHSITSGAIFTGKTLFIKDLHDLKGKSVVVQKGDIVGEYLSQQNLDIRLIEVSTVAEALALVSNETYEYAGILKLPGLYTIKEKQLSNLQAQKLVLTPNDYCMAVKKGNENLLLTLNGGLEIAKATGDYQKIYEKWLGVYEEKNLITFLKSYSWAFFLTAGIMALLIFWGFTLKHLVKVKTRELQYANESLQKQQTELIESNQEIEASFEQIIAIEQEVSRQKIIFEALFYHTPDAVVLLDQNHLVRDINTSFEKLFGYSLNEIQGMELDGILASAENLEEANQMRFRLLHGQEVEFESIRFGKGNIPIDVAIKGIPISYQNWSTGGYAVYSDITLRKTQELKLLYQSRYDDLTGLYNRRYFVEQLTNFDYAFDGTVSVIVADVNGLTLTNDAFGVAVGDTLLKSFADILQDECLSANIIARIGGDDFAVVFHGESSDNIEQIVQNIKTRCGQVRLNDITLSVSLGWAEKKVPSEKLSSTLKTAEIFMNRHKLTETSSARGETIQTIINTLHEKNKREEEHSQRVSILSCALGEALGLDYQHQLELKTMGLLHDIGKIAIDDTILNKSGKLTSEEYDEIKRHPEIGYRILSSVNDMAVMAEHVLAHHERWDGKGYPKGLKGLEIPYLSRIICVVDSYDAMTRDRAYRKAMTVDYALKELKDNAGIQFDPEIVSVFLARPDIR